MAIQEREPVRPEEREGAEEVAGERGEDALASDGGVVRLDLPAIEPSED